MKMRDVVDVALNGDAPNVEPAVRRTLYSLAHELDDREVHLQRALDTMTESFGKEVQSVKRLLITLTGTVATGIILAIGQVLLQL